MVYLYRAREYKSQTLNEGYVPSQLRMDDDYEFECHECLGRA